jgi:hypothetical protein
MRLSCCNVSDYMRSTTSWIVFSLSASRMLIVIVAAAAIAALLGAQMRQFYLAKT